MTSTNKLQIVTPCPRCGNLVFLPPFLSTQAVVRCPKCHNSYNLESVLPSDLPELEIVSFEALEAERNSIDPNSQPSPTEKIQIETKFQVPFALKNGARRRRRHSDNHEISKSNDALLDEQTEPSAPEQPTTETVQDFSFTPSTRPVIQTFSKSKSGNEGRHRTFRKRTRSKSVSETLKVVMGALFALPVAQIIIWWGLGLDPLNLGPQVGKAIPVLVPSSLRNPETRVPSMESSDFADPPNHAE